MAHSDGGPRPRARASPGTDPPRRHPTRARSGRASSVEDWPRSPPAGARRAPLASGRSNESSSPGRGRRQPIGKHASTQVSGEQRPVVQTKGPSPHPSNQRFGRTGRAEFSESAELSAFAERGVLEASVAVFVNPERGDLRIERLTWNSELRGGAVRPGDPAASGG